MSDHLPSARQWSRTPVVARNCVRYYYTVRKATTQCAVLVHSARWYYTVRNCTTQYAMLLYSARSYYTLCEATTRCVKLLHDEYKATTRWVLNKANV